MIRSVVACIFIRASLGIRYSLLCSPSFTNSWRDLPKMLDSQIFAGAPGAGHLRHGDDPLPFPLPHPLRLCGPHPALAADDGGYLGGDVRLHHMDARRARLEPDPVPAALLHDLRFLQGQFIQAGHHDAVAGGRLPRDHWLQKSIYQQARLCGAQLERIAGAAAAVAGMAECENIDDVRVSTIDLGSGSLRCRMDIPGGLFYRILGS